MLSPNFSKFSIKPLTLLKFIGLLFALILVLAVGVRLLTPPVQSLLQLGNTKMSAPGTAEFYATDAASSYYGDGAPELSMRNILPEPPMEEGSVGDDAEAFEATDYRATIETRELSRTCATIADLKSDEDIIFEVSNESDHSCSYTFKVADARVDFVLATLNELNPRELAERTRTIQRTVDDYTSEIEILEKKKEVIEQTLETATAAYDQITTLATNAQDAASLAKIIDSKIQTIERLTQQRLSVNAQLDRLARSKAQQLDHVEYTTFFVHVYENVYVDGEDLKDSWKAAVKEFVRDVNAIGQDLSVGLVTLVLVGAQYLLYFFLLLLVAKIAWQAAKKIWKK